MNRLINYYLRQWKHSIHRKALLIRGARQVGKTYAVRDFGKSFDGYVEINLEKQREAHQIFQGDLNPKEMLQKLSLVVDQKIIPGQTLLFLDEIQIVPRALTALRYFYEEMPELHIIAAGSLLDFAVEKEGIPVGRVQSLYMYPLSFIEFLAAMDKKLLVEEIYSHTLDSEMSVPVHKKLLKLVAEYLVLGGMPEVVQCWKSVQDAKECTALQNTILDTYQQDFGKYAKARQIDFLEILFREVPRQLGHRFKYSTIGNDFRKRDLAPALKLLETAGLVHPVYHSSGQGIPIGAQSDPEDFKTIFLDIGLSQALLGLDLAQWFLDPLGELVNKGPLIESFVGQELLAYGNPHKNEQLYYWHRETRTSQAEIDYAIQCGQVILPIEVKGGSGNSLKSLHIFLETHSHSPYGIRFSTHNYSRYEKVHSYPLYAVIKAASGNSDLQSALQGLFD